MPALSVLVKLALLAGCSAPPEDPPAPHTAPEVEWTAGRNGFPAALAAHPEYSPPSLREGPLWRGPPPPPAEAVLPDRVLPDAVGARSVVDAAIDMDRGAEILERLDELPSARVNQWGLGALTVDEIFGTDDSEGICEDPGIDFEFIDDGTEYEMEVNLAALTVLIGDPEPMFVSISAACSNGVAATGGDIQAAVDAGDCAEDEAQTFFGEGTTCRACVEEGGDYPGCQSSGACPDEAPIAVWSDDADGVRTWYRGVYATVWGCAPDLPAQVYLMAKMGDDGVLPRAFDNTAWPFFCTPFWQEDDNTSDIMCYGNTDPSLTGVLAEGMFGLVDYLRPSGEDVLGWRGRQFYVDRVEVDNGATLSWFFATNPGLGAVSATNVVEDGNGDGVIDAADPDYGYGGGGYGFDPGAFRPDGESYARDWLAAATLKTATTINGIAVVPYQTSRCAEWEGPADDGSYRCVTLGEPTPGYINDLYTGWSNTEHTSTFNFPMTTMASTGYLDPDVPGGYITHIAGTPALALPGFDACTLPHTFVPDTAAIEATPLDYGGFAPLDAQTWNFAKPDNTFRVAMATNRPRGWCGGDASGGGRSRLDF